ncbi:MAG: hypothetical protein UX02_C0002G0243 [Candidatus Moranbacteria bacterium GW2011_GWC1_45_18]|nr:MAG: hypothetical protein UT79_C0001G0218 [Candidatus Moranbacteria bacterium GW2011_GWC2_40_12]KKT33377.1 MAG: hypothetical protein UW19_C0009G0023 [Candidatus Moranbacteria bacterium GW2011_GWF2_44_10]KKT99924.1 MAG: hypothetical protein UX02_C0002G0243 [Candidatus Moranbacteria bacterium GW2011_GWC1_45_18]
MSEQIANENEEFSLLFVLNSLPIREFLHSLNYPSLCEIIRAHFNQYPVARQKPDIVHPHSSRNMGQYFMPVFKLDFECRAGKRLLHYAI